MTWGQTRTGTLICKQQDAARYKPVPRNRRWWPWLLSQWRTCGVDCAARGERPYQTTHGDLDTPPTTSMHSIQDMRLCCRSDGPGIAAASSHHRLVLLRFSQLSLFHLVLPILLYAKASSVGLDCKRLQNYVVLLLVPPKVNARQLVKWYGRC